MLAAEDALAPRLCTAQTMHGARCDSGPLPNPPPFAYCAHGGGDARLFSCAESRLQRSLGCEAIHGEDRLHDNIAVTHID